MGDGEKPENVVYVTSADLPVQCPSDQQELWNTHPRVYLAIEKNGSIECPYCGTLYILREV